MSTGQIPTELSCGAEQFIVEQAVMSIGFATRAGATAAPMAPMAAPMEVGAAHAVLTPDEPSRGVVINANRWENGTTLRVRFLDGDGARWRKVEEIATKWTRFANLQFEFVGSGEAQIRVSFNQQGHWSYVGKGNLNVASNQPTMNLQFASVANESDFRRVVLHEFGHAIGMEHEHQHPGGDIRWNEPAVLDYYRRTQGWNESMVRHNVLNRLSKTITNHTDRVDPQSIMMYPIAAGLANIQVDWNLDLSTTDERFIGTIYPKSIPPASDEIELVVGGPRREDFIDRGQVDKFRFRVQQPMPIIIRTHGSLPLGMKLYDSPARTTPIRQDEGGDIVGLNSMIADFLQPGTYHLDVYHLARSSGQGVYSISII